MSKSSPKAVQVKIQPEKPTLQVQSLQGLASQLLSSKIFQYSLVIIAITFISFFPSLKGGFLSTWDDEKYVTGNQVIKELNGEHVIKMFTRPVNGTYAPLPLLTFAIEYKLFGDNPIPFHATNLILHLLCTLLVFKILRLLKLELVFAAFGAVLFAIHPMRVESVAWITERKDVLYGFFYFASIIAYIRYVAESPQKQKFLVYGILLFVGSLLSKIEAVTLPLSLLLIDFLMRRPLNMKLLTEKIPFFLLSLFFGMLGIYIIYRVGLHTPELLKTDRLLSFSSRLLYGLYAFTGYIFKFFVPVSLCAMYPYPIMTGWTMIWIRFLNPSLIVVLIFIVGWSLRKTRTITFGILFFFFNIFFLLQIFAVGNGFFADRYTYIPYFGLIFITLWFIGEVAKKYSEKRVWILITLAVITVTGVAGTFSRSNVWKDEVSLWSDVISQNPDRNMEPYVNRGVAYTVRHDWENAIKDYTRAISIGPVSAEVYADRGIVYGFTGQQENAVADFTKALEINPKNTKALFNRGVTYGNMGQADRAIIDFRRVIVQDSIRVSAYAGLCILLMEQKKLDTCMLLAEKGLKIDQYRSDLYAIMGNCELEKGDPDKAMATFRHCLRIDYNNIDAWLGLAAAAVIKDDHENAVKNLELAREAAQQQNIRIDTFDDIRNAGITLLDIKKAAIQKLFTLRR